MKKSGVIAIIYAIGALFTSILMSIYEGTFLEISHLGATKIYPFLYNFSTLLDFSIFNPLIIYFLLISFWQKYEIYEQLGQKIMSKYHYIGIGTVCLVVAFKLLWFYVEGFSGGQYYDALVQPIDGIKTITWTGYVSFFWTGIFMSILLFFSLVQFTYTRFILSLKEIDYDPHHEDSLGGQKKFLQPILNFSYAMFFLLAVFIIFIIYDYVFEISDSNRVYGLMFYVLIITPNLLLPIFHLHKLMNLEKSKYLKRMRSKFNLHSTKKKGVKGIKNETDLFAYMNQGLALIKNYPVWPINKVNMFFPSTAIILSTVDIVKFYSL